MPKLLVKQNVEKRTVSEPDVWWLADFCLASKFGLFSNVLVPPKFAWKRKIKVQNKKNEKNFQSHFVALAQEILFLAVVNCAIAVKL